MVSSTNQRPLPSIPELEAAVGLALLNSEETRFKAYKSILFSTAKKWHPLELEALCTAVAEEQTKKIGKMNWLEVAEKVHKVTASLTLPRGRTLQWLNTDCKYRWVNLCDLYNKKVLEGKFIDDPNSVFHMNRGASSKNVQKKK